MSDIVGIIKSDVTSYPQKGDYRPPVLYPEFSDTEDYELGTNRVYDMVRELFHIMGFDEANFGTKNWNPLGDYIKPGNCVLIKPNLVMDVNCDNNGTECLYTQPAVVAPVLDYIIKALEGCGKIYIGDAPMQECNFDNLLNTSGYKELLQYYVKRTIDVELIDFRELHSSVKNGIYKAEINNAAHGTIIDLGKNSEFYGMDIDQINNLRVTNYDPRILKLHHTIDKHEYYISDYVLNADVIINMPKPKSHRKAGVTISLKNFVGANVRKEFLPHHTIGSKDKTGDEYNKSNTIHSFRTWLCDKKNICQSEEKYFRAKLYRYLMLGCSLLLKLSKEHYQEGSWYGNDTISKTIADINKIVYYADKTGKMRDKQTRKVLIVADMIIAGEKEGPVQPSPKKVGMVACGTNPVLFDETIATIMGFDYKKIPSIVRARKMKSVKFRLVNGEIAKLVSNIDRYNGICSLELNSKDYLGFEPSSGWKGHIEK